jgi:hypothetical protein
MTDATLARDLAIAPFYCGDVHAGAWIASGASPARRLMTTTPTLPPNRISGSLGRGSRARSVGGSAQPSGVLPAAVRGWGPPARF